MTITGVPLSHLRLAWAVLWPMLEPAAKRSPDFLRAQPGEQPDACPEPAEWVLARLIVGDAQLWAILDNDQPVAAVATMIKLIDGEKRCLLWLVGACPEASRRGSRMRGWAGDFMAACEAWARGLGCVAVYGCGRRGWARIVAQHGGTSIEPIDGLPAWKKEID